MKTTILNQIKDHILEWSLGNLSQDDCEIKDNKLYFYQLNHHGAYANTPVGRYHFTETEIEATASISVVGDTIHCVFTDAYSLRTIKRSNTMKVSSSTTDQEIAHYLRRCNDMSAVNLDPYELARRLESPERVESLEDDIAFFTDNAHQALHSCHDARELDHILTAIDNTKGLKKAELIEALKDIKEMLQEYQDNATAIIEDFIKNGITY